VTAAIAGALSPLVATNGLYGLELNSYLWAGGGLFTQVVALHPMLAALGLGYRAMRTGQGLTLTGALIGVVMMCHIVYGYFTALTMGMLWLLPLAGSTRRERFWRLGWIGATSMALTAFALLPLVTDGAFLNRSRWEPVWKWDSFGAAAVIEWLFTGQLMDFGRMPLLTVAAAVGAGMAAWAIYRSKDTVERFLLGGAIFWILLFFGRPAWGAALLLLGMTQDMHIHRAIGPVQIFLLFLAAMGVAGAWQKYKVAMAVLGLLALVPMVQERARMFTLNREWGERNLRVNEAAAPVVNRVIDLARNAGGRTYAGLGANWGANLKVGDVPVYARLARAHVPALSYLYHAMPLAADLMVRFDEQNVAQYRLFHIRTVIGAVGARMPGFLLQSETAGTLGVWQAPGGGAFECVDVPAAMRYTRENFYPINDQWLQSDWVGRRQHILMHRDADTPPGMMAVAPDGRLPALPASAGTPGEVVGESDLIATVEAARDCYVMLKASWHPGWRVTVDGQQAEFVMVSPGFPAVKVGAGRHKVAFAYESGTGRYWLALAGLLAVIGLGWAERRR
jgi:hypothetical protein